MRVDVKKYAFLGRMEDRDAFFRRAQQAGVVEFIDSRGKVTVELTPEIKTLMSAIRIANTLPVMKSVDVTDIPALDILAAQMVSLKKRMETLQEERRILRQELVRVGVFGDFSFDDVHYIERQGHRHIQFFCAKKGINERIHDVPGLFFVGSDHGLDYFLSVQKEAKAYDDMIEMRVERTPKQLAQRGLDIDREIYTLGQRLNTFSQYRVALHKGLLARGNIFNLEATKRYVEKHLSNAIFAVQGWVAVSRQDELKKLLDEGNVYCEEVAAEPTDSQPTFLDNAGTSRLGEDLIDVYDTPSTEDKDPSPWVMWSFLLFFSIIVGDAGYGLILLAITLFLRHKFPDVTGINKRILKLGTLLATGCIVFGVLTTSFFGTTISYENPIRKASLLTKLSEMKAEHHFAFKDATYDKWVAKYPNLKGLTNAEDIIKTASTKDKEGNVSYEMLSSFSDNILLEFALIVGTVHICLSLLRYSDKSIKNLGWVLFILGLYMWVPTYLKVTSIVHVLFHIDAREAPEGYVMMFSGLGFATLVSLIQRKLLGLVDVLSSVTQIFADILSYLRLYALGLSGSIVSATMNDMSHAVGIFFGVFVLVLAHSLNFTLSLMGGVIHGLRLNFIEWYHYSFDGGGRKFRPLKQMIYGED